MDNIVITGACGHIGSSLLESLPEHVNVIAVDNMLTQRYSSLFALNNKIKFYESNFLDIDIPEGSTVIHLGAITDAASSINNTEQVEKINIFQTLQFIDKCIQSKVKRFIFPSSTSVYGVAQDVVNEDDSKFENPQSPYAESKLVIEKYLESKKGSLEYVVVRFGTIFGTSKGMRFHTAVNKFCWQASLKLPITVWKENFHQTRPYLGLKDAIKALNHVMNLDSKHCNTKYNVLTGNYKLSEIVDIIKQQVPDLQVEMVNTPLLNQYSYHVDSSKIQATGFIANCSLDTEIKKTLSLLNKLA